MKRICCTLAILSNLTRKGAIRQCSVKHTRNHLPKDSHLIEQELPNGVNIEQGPLEQVEEEDIDLDSEIVTQLNDLHSHEKLTSPNIKLNDIPVLHKKLQEELLESELDETLDTVPLNQQVET